MYVLYVTVLTIGVYVAPGLALMPRAAFDSRLAYAIPIVSVLLVTSIARALKPLGAFTETTVLVTSLSFAVLAVCRVWIVRARTEVHWPVTHRLIYMGSLCAGLFAAGELGLEGFEVDDEIFSWNLWAIQHAHGEPHDLFYTSYSPYPQTFSYLIAWKYQLLHSTDLQLPVKCSLAILTVSMAAAIGTAGRNFGAWSLYGFAGLAVVAFATSNLWSGVTRGLAETLMVPALTVSIALYLQWKRYPERTIWLWLASGCAVVAGLTKQPALLWLMLVFPVLVAAGRRPRDNAALIPVALAVCAGAVWLVTEGAGFWNNPRVIRHSQQDRDWLEQLLYASQAHLWEHPALSILLILCGYCVLRERSARGLYFGLILPFLILWLFFGAYASRLGTHVLTLSALLIVAHDYWPGRKRGSHGVSTRSRRLAQGGISIAVIFASISAWDTYKKRDFEFSFYDGGKNTINRYFGKDSDYIFNQVYKSDSTLWVPSDYIYGIFYSHNPIIRPNHRAKDFDAEYMRTSILRDRPDYLFDPGTITFKLMKSSFPEFLRRCKNWFEVVASPPNFFNFTVYRLKTDALDRDQECAQ